MRRVHRQYLTRDSAGRPLSVHSEHLTDDGEGQLELNSERTALRCSGCTRPVTELAELRGTCDWCRTRECCVHCISQCQVCARRLCGHCRRGFAGPPALTVCIVCQQRLLERQMFQDRLLLERTDFERHVVQQRIAHQMESLRQASERMQLMAQFQAARLGLPVKKVSPLWWTARLTGRVLVKGFQYARRLLP